MIHKYNCCVLRSNKNPKAQILCYFFFVDPMSLWKCIILVKAKISVSFRGVLNTGSKGFKPGC